MSAHDLAASRQGEAADPRAAAALTFVRAIIERRGAVTDEEMDRVRAAGYDDRNIVEMIAHVALNTFTNYFNIVARTPTDDHVVERS